MTITSTNHNPNNESKYARHRSIWKGNDNQLRRTVASLNGTPGIVGHEYWNVPLLIAGAFLDDWGVSLSATRRPPKGFEILGSWSIDPPTQRILHAVPGALRGDLKLLWSDFITVVGRRIGFSNGAGADPNDRYNGKSLVVFAPGQHSFDLIASKYGYGDNLKRNHHFFHWQARSSGFEGLVNVDDYESGETGLVFYVVS